MRLTIVGCSGSYPGPESPASCYLVEEPDPERPDRTWRLLLDLGSGSLGALQRYVDPLAIDGLFLSHLHPDHCMDLCGYHVLRKYHPDGPQPRVPVWGPVGTATRMAAAYGMPSDPGMTGEFDFHTHADDGDPVGLGPFTVQAIRVEHPVPAYAFRVTCGDATLVYTGDTGPCDALHTLAAGADLLLAEASFRVGEDNPAGIHLTGRDAGDIAARAGAKRLVLTHIPAWHDPRTALAEASSAFGGTVDLALANTDFLI